MFLSLYMMLLGSFTSAVAVDVEGAACIYSGASLEKSVGQAYHQALQIETRKAGLPLQWRTISAVEDCDSDQPLVVITDDQIAHLTQEDGERLPIALGGVEQDFRARTLATSVLGRLSKPTQDLDLPLLGSEEIALGASGDPALSIVSLDAEVERPNKSGMGGTFGLGPEFVYFSPKKTAWGGGAHAAATFFDGRLLVGLSGIALWSRWGAGSKELERLYRVTLGEGLLTVRGGHVTNRWGIRGGLALGLQRRTIVAEFEPDEIEGFEEIDWMDNTTHGVTAIQGEGIVRFADRWQVSLLVEPRLVWNRIEGEVLNDPAFRAHLRLGLNL